MTGATRGGRTCSLFVEHLISLPFGEFMISPIHYIFITQLLVVLVSLSRKSWQIDLTNWLVDTKKLSEYQIGFRPQCRNSDHIIVLKSIIDFMRKKTKKKVFACFIDFRKAFDSVWRDGLLFKLQKWRLGTKLCSMLKKYV